MRSIDEYIYFNFAVLSISGSAWTALDSMFELTVCSLASANLWASGLT